MKNWFELIKRAGIAPTVVHDEEQYPAELVRLCELVAAAEREACAKVCDGEARNWVNFSDTAMAFDQGAVACAAAIRAGGAK